MFDNVKQIVEEYGISKAVFEKRMKGAFDEIFKVYFEKCPEVSAVGWNQYTPYFNDGESCEFSVGDFYPVVVDNLEALEGVSASDLEEMEWPYTTPSEWVRKCAEEYKTMSPEEKQKKSYYEYYVKEVEAYESKPKDEAFERIASTTQELLEVLRSIPDEIFHSAFDDHVTVIFTKNGATVNDYEHD